VDYAEYLQVRAPRWTMGEGGLLDDASPPSTHTHARSSPSPALLQRQRGLVAAATAVRDLAAGGGSAATGGAPQHAGGPVAVGSPWTIPSASDADNPAVATWVLPGPSAARSRSSSAST